MNPSTWVTPTGLGALGLALVLAGCGGGGGGGVGGPPPPTTYTVGGTVTGLAGSGLVLRDNGGDDLPVAANGTFTFATSLANGAAFATTVSSQPTNLSQSCTISNGSGSVAGADVTTVAVKCTTNSYTISVTVSGLTGTGLILQDMGGDNLAVSGNGTFNFLTLVASGSPYAVTVLTQPGGPAQTCTVSAGSGTVTNASVTTASVQCAAQAFARFAYVMGWSGPGNPNLKTLGLDALTGQMTPLGGVFADEMFSVATAPNGRFVYAADNTTLASPDGGVRGYSVDPATGNLTEIPGSPFPAGINPWGTAIDPSGNFMYVANIGAASVTALSIHPLTGVLTPIATYGGTPGVMEAVAADPAGRGFVYATAVDVNAVVGWVANSSTGALTPIAGGAVPTGRSPTSIAIDSTGAFAYVANTLDKTISAYTINPTSGALTEVAGSPFPAAAGAAAPLGLTASPRAGILYASNYGSGSGVGVFSIDATTGALNPISGSPFAAAGTNPASIAIDPSGRFAYTIDTVTGDVVAFAIDPQSGALAPLANGGRSNVGAQGIQRPQAIAIARQPLTITAPMIYLADRDQVGTPELYQGATKLNPTFRPGTVVTSFALTADARSVLYIADQDTSGVPELYVVSLAKPGIATKVNATLTAGGSVMAFAPGFVTSTSIAYIASQDNANVAELYLADLTKPGISTKLNSKLAAGASVGVESAQTGPNFTLIYRAQQDSATQFELYRVDPAKPGTTVKVSAPLVAGGSVENFFVTTDGSGSPTVLYRAEQDNPATTELYVVSLQSPSVSQKLNAPLKFGGNVQSFAAWPTMSGVLYRADQDIQGVTELYLVPYKSPGVAQKLNPPLAAGRSVQFFEPAAVGSTVAYVANQDSATTFEIYAVDATRPGTSTKLNAPLIAGGNVQAFLYEADAQFPILYLADQDTKGVPELYGVSPTTPGTSVKINPPLHAGQAVTHFDYDGFDSVALYLCNQAQAAEVDLFGVLTTAPGVAVRLDAPLQPGGNVEDFAVE